jgi:hypothetical protein
VSLESFFVSGPTAATDARTWHAKGEYLRAEDGAANHEMMLLPTKDSIDVIIRRFPFHGFDYSHVTF